MTVLELINYLETLPDTMLVKMEGTCAWCGTTSLRDAGLENFPVYNDTLEISPPNVDDHNNFNHNAL